MTNPSVFLKGVRACGAGDSRSKGVFQPVWEAGETGRIGPPSGGTKRSERQKYAARPGPLSHGREIKAYSHLK